MELSITLNLTIKEHTQLKGLAEEQEIPIEDYLNLLVKGHLKGMPQYEFSKKILPKTPQKKAPDFSPTGGRAKDLSKDSDISFISLGQIRVPKHLQ